MRVERDDPVRAVRAVVEAEQVQSDDLLETIPPLAFLMQRKPHCTDCVDPRVMGDTHVRRMIGILLALNRPGETLQCI